MNSIGRGTERESVTPLAGTETLDVMTRTGKENERGRSLGIHNSNRGAEKETTIEAGTETETETEIETGTGEVNVHTSEMILGTVGGRESESVTAAHKHIPTEIEEIREGRESGEEGGRRIEEANPQAAETSRADHSPDPKAAGIGCRAVTWRASAGEGELQGRA